MVLSKKQILKLAKDQLAIDLACNSSDFNSYENKVVIYKKIEGSRPFFKEDYFFKVATFGRGAVISCNESLQGWSKRFFKNYDGINSFEHPIMSKIDRELNKYNKKLDVVHEIYLPSVDYEVKINKDLEIKFFEKDEIKNLYCDERFTNALVYDENFLRPDVLALVAYENGEIIAVAGAGEDCDKLWQIGIDVLPEHRGKGIAKTLVQLLTKEILNRGIVPYYGTWASNIISRNLAQSCGYFPAWVEMHAIDKY